MPLSARAPSRALRSLRSDAAPSRPKRASHAVFALIALLATASASTRVRADDHDPWLGRDKALHASLSFGLAAAGYALSAPLVEPRPARAACGVAFSLSLGAAKELYDYAGHGTPSGRDFAWDVLGALSGAGVAALFDFAWARLRDRRERGAARAQRSDRALGRGSVSTTF